ncbi:MAG: HEAT repeat domain-containing protein, partial [Myxococcales bacterium]
RQEFARAGTDDQVVAALDSVPLLTQVLAHQDRNTRETAVNALADVGSPAARTAIENRLKVEPDAALKKSAQEVLARWK